MILNTGCDTNEYFEGFFFFNVPTTAKREKKKCEDLYMDAPRL